jgi:hypothetical protein
LKSSTWSFSGRPGANRRLRNTGFCKTSPRRRAFAERGVRAARAILLVGQTIAPVGVAPHLQRFMECHEEHPQQAE